MKLLYCLAPRTGSSVIARSLSLSCRLSLCPEPFNPDCHNGRFAMDYKILSHKKDNNSAKDIAYDGYQNFSDAYEAIVADRQNWNFIKHLDPQLYPEDGIKLMDKCDKIIYLYRKNLFDIIISLYLSYMLGVHTEYKFWNFDDRVLLNDKSFLRPQQKESYEAYLSTVRPSVDPEWVIDVAKRYKWRHSEIKKELTGRNYIIESYERFYGDPGKYFPQMAEFFNSKIIDSRWEKLTRPQNKISSPEVRKLIPNYDEVKKFENEFILDD